MPNFISILCLVAALAVVPTVLCAPVCSGDAACGNEPQANKFSNNGVYYCCPTSNILPSASNYANPSTYSCPVTQTCSNSPNNSLSIMRPCASSYQACSAPGTIGCGSFSLSNAVPTSDFRPATMGYAACAAGLQPRIDMLRIVATSGGSSFSVRLVDWQSRNGVYSDSSIVLVPTQTSTACYELTRPYLFKASTNGLTFTCSSASGCAGTVQSSVTCVTPPTGTQCASGPAPGTPGTTPPFSGFSPCTQNPTMVRGNDNTQYCCDNNNTPTFGQAGYCTCPTGTYIFAHHHAFACLATSVCFLAPLILPLSLFHSLSRVML
jgi:hypothetical protein